MTIEGNVDILFSQHDLRKVQLTFPDSYVDALLVLRQSLEEKRITQVYVRMSKPKKPRSTGYRSQNHHIHGHATEIANAVSESKSKIITDAVDLAMGMLGRDFPTHIDYKGDIVPDSEPDWDTVTAAAVIEALHQIASMVPVQLTEYDE